MDQFPSLRQTRLRATLFRAAFVLLLFVLGLPMTTGVCVLTYSTLYGFENLDKFLWSLSQGIDPLWQHMIYLNQSKKMFC